MSMNRQSVSIIAIIVGVGCFLQRMSELLSHHGTWAELATPAGVGDVAAIAGAALLMAAGALGTTIKGKPDNAIKPRPHVEN